MAARGDTSRGTARGSATDVSSASHRPIPDALRERTAARLRAHEQRLTAGREQLIEVLAATDRPLTIPEILDARPGLAQSSAYRNLVVLEEAGVVHCIITRDEFARYELAEDLTGHHHHLVCITCGRVEDLPATPALERSVEAAVALAARTNGFRTNHHRLDFVGVCADCA
jgi:Fur family transcriptional regulator, ferric uptake regulator